MGKEEETMGMTNKQYQGFIRLALAYLLEILAENPDDEKVITLVSVFQSMLEDA